MKLKTQLKKVITEYTKEFYTILTDEPYDKDNAYWIAGDYTGVCGIGDYYVGLSDMVLVVDNKISGEDYIDWYWTYVAEYMKGDEQYINLRHYAMNKGYKIK
jgi:hypothetical protein